MSSGDLFPMSFSCGDSNAPGTTQFLYVVPASELTGMPATLEDNGGTEPEDDMILDAPWSFIPDSGLGYWRKVRIIRDTGQITFPMEGEISGRAFNNQIIFQIPRIDTKQKKWAAIMANACVVGMLKDREGVMHVVGTDEDPAVVSELTGDSGVQIGDRRSVAFTLQATGSIPHYTYDDETHGINLTPNV